MFSYKIKSIKFKNNTEIKPGCINVFVGANNCGKTQLLKDLLNLVTGNNKSNILISEIEDIFPNSFNEIEMTCEEDIKKIDNKEQLIYIQPELNDGCVTFDGNDIKDYILKHFEHNDKNFLRQKFGSGIIKYLKTDTRLSLTNNCKIKDPMRIGATNLMEAILLLDEKSMDTFKSKIKNILNVDVEMDKSSLNTLKIRIGDDFSKISKDFKLAHKEFEKYALLDDQGDGMRSIIGIISALIAVKRPITLLDEPEAFLHPPQAIQLGQCISELIDKDQQIFIATHSADFLRGLLSSTKDAVIIHMDRSANNEMDINILDSDTLNEIIYNPILSSSRVLEGMFYKGVVITEADADSTFYQRAFQNIGAADEIHFVHAHNKQTIKKLLIPYEKLGIKHAAITDIDIIREEQDLKNLITMADVNLQSIILQNRLKILEDIQKRSKSELLNNLLSKIHEISKIPSFKEEESESILISLKRELKKICKESNEFSELKKSGYRALSGETLEAFNNLYENCTSIGLFIVKVGELESWLDDYDYPRLSDKSKWITGALEKIFDMTPDRNKELWKFIYELKDYIIN